MAKFPAVSAEADRVTRRGLLKRALAGGVTVAALPLLSEEARADLFMPGVADQKRLGAQAAHQVLAKYHEVKDDRARNFAQVGAQLVSALSPQDRSTWDYNFKVIESKEINAFALPGGNMFMFTGLLNLIHSNDVLAAVTGHEMTHVRLQHWAHAVASREKREFGISAVLAITHAGRGWQTIAGLGDSLLTLRYSRKEEDQADAGGLQNMVAAGFDPHGMLELFHTLQTATGNQGEQLAFLSDHPLTAERIRRTQERIDRLARNGRHQG